MQHTAIFHACKNDKFHLNIFDYFLIFAQNIECGYSLEPPQSVGSNEYQQSMFWSKNKKKIYLCKPQFYYIKVGCKGVYITRTCYHDGFTKTHRGEISKMNKIDKGDYLFIPIGRF